MSVFIIAEAGVNHNGSLKLAKQLVEAAKDAGVNAIKFQSFRADNLVVKQAPKALYQKQQTESSESQLQMLQKLQLSFEEQRELFDYSRQQGITFISSPFDPQSANFLIHDLGLKRIKLGSGELTNAQLLYTIGQAQCNLILSTGMSDLVEIEQALSVLAFAYTNYDNNIPNQALYRKAYQSNDSKNLLRQKVSLMHCTTEYPCPYQEVNLHNIQTIKDHFGLATGYSDHTSGIHISLAAVSKGAEIIEKHFTLDKNLPGPDHQASITAEELKQMVQQIRDIEISFGSKNKHVTDVELKNRPIVRKGIYAQKPIAKGEKFDPQNISVKRPETPLSAHYYWDLMGRVAQTDYVPDQAIDKNDLV